MNKILLIIMGLLLSSCSYRDQMDYQQPTDLLIGQINSFRGAQYTLKNYKPTEMGGEWEVWYDVSGLWMKIDSLQVWLEGRKICFKGGNERLINDLKEWLKNPPKIHDDIEKNKPLKIFNDYEYKIQPKF